MEHCVLSHGPRSVLWLLTGNCSGPAEPCQVLLRHGSDKSRAGVRPAGTQRRRRPACHQTPAPVPTSAVSSAAVALRESTASPALSSRPVHMRKEARAARNTGSAQMPVCHVHEPTSILALPCNALTSAAWSGKRHNVAGLARQSNSSSLPTWGHHCGQQVVGGGRTRPARQRQLAAQRGHPTHTRLHMSGHN
jgi:hypothetical protein